MLRKLSKIELLVEIDEKRTVLKTAGAEGWPESLIELLEIELGEVEEELARRANKSIGRQGVYTTGKRCTTF